MEVVVGSASHGWPLGCQLRRIDGVRVVAGAMSMAKSGTFVCRGPEEFEAAIAGVHSYGQIE